ncbi:adenylosuccinate synthetase [Nanoarchaeota archaeon]
MVHINVVGCQWGDEGKAKCISHFVLDKEGKVDIVVRYQGGANAGHTSVNDYGHFHTHLLPSGAVVDGKNLAILPEVALDPIQFMLEIYDVENDYFDANPKKIHMGVKDPIIPRLMIDKRTKLLLPWYRALDAAEEIYKGKDKVGTTLRGIGPFYQDIRGGIRIGDLLKMSENKIKGVVNKKSEFFNNMINHCYQADQGKMINAVVELSLGGQGVYGHISKLDNNETMLNFSNYYNPIDGFNESNIVNLLLDFKNKFESCVTDVIKYFHDNKDEKNFLFEGAQAVHLDKVLGTYPYVTSSHPTPGGLAAQGIPIEYIDRRIGVAKAYNTRVGNGPFPSIIKDQEVQDEIRKKGGEYGTTTGRPRDCGWHDADQLRESVLYCNLNELAITKLDVLSGLDKVCIYSDGVFEEYDGWEEFDRDSIENFESFPDNAQKFIHHIDDKLVGTGAGIKYVTYGPEDKYIVKTGFDELGAL